MDDCITVAIQRHQHRAKIVERDHVPGCKRQRPMQTGQRLVMTIQQVQCMATAAVRVDKIGFPRERLVVTLNCLGRTVQPDQRVTTVVVGLCKLRLERDDAVVTRQRLVVAADIVECCASIAPVVDRIGSERQRAIVGNN
jgi:hypothetical protein